MPHLATDLFLNEALRGSRLVLVDINPDAADLMLTYCTKLSERIGGGWSVEVSDLDTALDGADGVCVSISTGGYDAMENDIVIPEKFGVYHSVGDTVGPGGISRTLWNVPILFGTIIVVFADYGSSRIQEQVRGIGWGSICRGGVAIKDWPANADTPPPCWRTFEKRPPLYASFRLRLAMCSSSSSSWAQPWK